MKPLTPKEIAAEIRVHFPHFKGGRFANDDDVFGAKTGAKGNQPADDTRKGSDLFHDYCQIGALMTDEAKCLGHLEALESELRAETGLKAGFGSKTPIPTFKPIEGSSVKGLKDLKLPAQNASASREKHIEAVIAEFKQWRNSKEAESYTRKFNGALQRVLQLQEDRYGFNGAQFDPALDVPVQPNQVAAKGSTPVLTGFVQPPEFKLHLLAQKRHWKDPGARPTHGEFTHRRRPSSSSWRASSRGRDGLEVGHSALSCCVASCEFVEPAARSSLKGFERGEHSVTSFWLLPTLPVRSILATTMAWGVCSADRSSHSLDGEVE